MRCDGFYLAIGRQGSGFQSTHLREVRQDGIWSSRELNLVFQSTHLREVRRNIRLVEAWLVIFQSTHLREVRRYDVACKISKQIKFKSTHLREVRRGMLAWNNLTNHYFNPRTYVRCDMIIPLSRGIVL